jgi:ABC-type sugar transport system substrate-binding protein
MKSKKTVFLTLLSVFIIILLGVLYNATVNDAFAGVFNRNDIAYDKPLGASLGSDTPSKRPEDKLRYALVVKNLTNPYWIDLKNGMETFCSDNEITLDIWSTNSDTAYDEQLMTCQSLLDKNYDAIFVTPLNNVTICSFIKACNDLNQAVFVLDSAADVDTLATLDARPTATFEADHYTAGCVAMEYMVEALGGTGNIVVLNGNMASEAAIQINYGIKDTLEENDGMTVLDWKAANWDKTMGQTVTSALLEAYDHIDGILAANDEMALGALEALEDKAMRGKITIVSINFMDEAQTAIKNGDFYASIDKGSYDQGYTSAKIARDYLLGEEIQDYYQVPVIGYTLEDLE